VSVVLEHISNHKEIDGHGDAIDGHRGEPPAHAEPQEKVEQGELQDEVEAVGDAEAYAVPLGRGFLEREAGGEDVVEQEAREIAHGKSHARVDEQLEREIDAVVERSGRHAHHGEADGLAER